MITSKMKWLIGGLTLIVFLAGGLFYFIATAPTDETIRQLQADADKLRRQGKYDRAEEYFRKSIKQANQKYGENNIAAASAYTGLGALFTQKQDHAKAADNLLLAADIYQHSAGNAIYPEKLFALKLAAVYPLVHVKDYKKVEEIFNFVEKHLQGLPPKLQFKYYLYRGQLYYYKDHDYKKSLPLLEKAYNCENFKSQEDIMELYELLGTSYNSLKQYKKSLPVLNKLLVMAQSKYGKDSYKTAIYHFFLAESLTGNKQYVDAEKNLLQSINLIDHSSEKNNPYSFLTFNSYLRLTSIAIKTKNKKKCSLYWKKVEALKKQTPGIDLRIYNIIKKDKGKQIL